MRLTVNLADDTYAIAKSLAHEEGTTVSKAVNQLLRRALEPANGQDGGNEWNDGLPVVKCRRTFTSEDVYRIDAENE